MFESRRTSLLPTFSVVIPTFNRAHLLPFAVRSVLQQSFGDFEIVISNGGSTDNTAEVVQSFNDRRIRYIESPSRLPVGENYQAGLDHATGEFITFLSDDDAYTPNLLKRVNDVLLETGGDIVGYRYCRYYHEDLCDFELDIPANSLLISKFDRLVTRFSSGEALDQVLSLHALSSTAVNQRFVCPYLSNATYRRSIFDSLRKKRKNLFDTVPADIYLAAAVFYEANSYHCVDEPLLVWSNWVGNSTATAQRTVNSVSEHYTRLLNGKELEHTPLKFPLALNCGANAVLEAVTELSDDSMHIDWTTYFVKTFENFIYLQSVGVDVSEERKEFDQVLALQPSEVREDVERQLSNISFRAKAFLNSQMPTVAARIRKFMNPENSKRFKIVSGSNAGFSNVVEASRNVS